MVMGDRKEPMTVCRFEQKHWTDLCNITHQLHNFGNLLWSGIGNIIQRLEVFQIGLDCDCVYDDIHRPRWKVVSSSSLVSRSGKALLESFPANLVSSASAGICVSLFWTPSIHGASPLRILSTKPDPLMG